MSKYWFNQFNANKSCIITSSPCAKPFKQKIARDQVLTAQHSPGLPRCKTWKVASGLDCRFSITHSGHSNPNHMLLILCDGNLYEVRPPQTGTITSCCCLSCEGCIHKHGLESWPKNILQINWLQQHRLFGTTTTKPCRCHLCFGSCNNFGAVFCFSPIFVGSYRVFNKTKLLHQMIVTVQPKFRATITAL